MRSKRIIRQMTALALNAILALTLAGCGSGGSETAQTEAQTEVQAEEPMEVQAEAPEKTSGEAASGEAAASGDSEGAKTSSDEPGYITAYRGLVKEMSDARVADQFIISILGHLGHSKI